MNKITLISAAALVALALNACKPASGGDSGSSEASDSEITRNDTIALPDTTYSSIEHLDWKVEVADSTSDGTIADLQNPYDTVSGSLTFRGNSRRDARYGGTVQGTPSKIVQDWMFETYFDTTRTKLGTWGGGSGWTGQPVYVEWSEGQMSQFRKNSGGLTPDFGPKEIIVGSLCSRLYFINYDSGKASREYIDVGNPIKGSVSLDPSLDGSLYVGQGVPAHEEIGVIGIDLKSHRRVFKFGRDPKAKRGWGAYDSSPVVVGDYLFWPGENGTFYKYTRLGGGDLRLHSTLRYTVGGSAPGAENSLCVYKNYGYFGDNHGNVLCVNLNTMKPVWYYDNHDDIDASIVLEVEDGVPMLYCGCEVDRQGDTGVSHFVKLNGLNGSKVWEQTFECDRQDLNGKHFDGGFYSTPLLGDGDCKELIFANVCQREHSKHAEFTAIDKRTGNVVYRTQLKYFAWSSPVAFYNEHKEMFVVTGDSSGNLYLLRGKTGEILFTSRMGNNFESSPVVIGNSMVVGSRGQEIYRFSVI